MTLGASDVPAATRRIYESESFRRVSGGPRRSFGKDLVGEYWERKLSACARKRGAALALSPRAV
jgi:hypothetical protein